MGYQFTNGWRIQLDALNLLNSSSYNASYAYGALLQSDALFAKCFPSSGAPTVPAAVCQNGFMDYSIHPLDSLAVRLTLAGPIDSIDIPRMATNLDVHCPLTSLRRRTTIGPASMSVPMPKQLAKKQQQPPSIT